MKNIFIVTIWALVTSAYAQVPQWALHPEYSSIKLLGNEHYVVSKNGKYGILRKESTKNNVALPIEYDSISVFRGHYALLFKSGNFVGYVSDTGNMKDLSDKNFKLTGLLAFSDGHVPVSNSNGAFFVRAKDGEMIGPYTETTTFCEGYARVKVPKSSKYIFDKSKSTNRYFAANTGEIIDNPKADFDYDAEDVNFISSVSNGKSIMVIKKRVYELSLKSKVLTPLASDGNTQNKKSRVFVPDSKVVPVANEEGDYVVALKGGTMTFDNLMRPKSINYGEKDVPFNIPKDVGVAHESPLKAVTQEGREKLSLWYKDKEILPAQFDAVKDLWGNEAIVEVNGKYGVVAVADAPNNNLYYQLNDNEDLGFHHKTEKTNVKVVCPPYMNIDKMVLVSEDENYNIDIDTRRQNANVQMTSLSYECKVNIPKDIDIAEKKDAMGIFSVHYDGLRFAPVEIHYKAWYINNYRVDIGEPQLMDNTVSVEVHISNNHSNNVHRIVEIDAKDSVSVNWYKINEELYKATFTNWKENNIRFTIDVTEDGCPTIEYGSPYSIDIKSHNAKMGQEKAEEYQEGQGATAGSQGRIKKRKAKATTPQVKEKKKFTL